VSTRTATKKSAAKKTARARQSSPLTVVIEASQWARGKMRGTRLRSYDEGNALLNDESCTMCCLGFDALACGLPPDAIREVGLPSGVKVSDIAPVEEKRAVARYKKSWLRKLKDNRGQKISGEDLAAEINDDDSITDDERIRRLRPVFAAVSPPRRIVWLKNR